MIVMLRKFSTYEFGIAELTYLRYKIAVAAVAALCIAAVDLGAREGSREWIVL